MAVTSHAVLLLCSRGGRCGNGQVSDIFCTKKYATGGNRIGFTRRWYGFLVSRVEPCRPFDSRGTLAANPGSHRARESTDLKSSPSYPKKQRSHRLLGKVVNPNQQPIEGVNVQYSYSTEHGNIVGAAWGEQRIHKSDASTDAAGMFVVSGIKGHTLSIESLTKEGYSYASRGGKVYNYYGDNRLGQVYAGAVQPDRFCDGEQS
jgi:hypothetical protein